MFTINDIRAANANRGFYFFESSTLRFFKSRVGERIHEGAGGVYFVTSEKGPSGIRAFTVRKFNPATGDVRTAGDFNVLGSAAAHGLAARLAADGEGETPQ